MPPKPSAAPPGCLFKKPGLRPEDCNANGLTVEGPRSYSSHHGKRGPMNHEVVSGSPRAVRARLQDKGPPSSACYFAVTRRCSFVERRGQARSNGQDSWEPSCIEPGAFTSVGSGTEVFEASIPVHSVGSWETSQSSRAQSQAGSADARLRLPSQKHLHGRSANHLDAPLHAPRGERPAPLPTPVRSMAVQANRDSILRHYKENGGSGSASDSDKENIADASQEVPAMTSARSGATGATLGDNMSVLNTARSVFRELQYPQQAVYKKSERMTKAATKAHASKSFNNADLAEALSCAVTDEYTALAQTWGVGCPGQEKRVEDRVALCLKKVGKRAEKICVEALASKKVMPSEDNSVESRALDEECARLEAEIVAADRRLAKMREAMHHPHNVESDPNHIVKDLLESLYRSSALEDVSAPMLEFDSMMNDSVQGLVQRLIAAGSSCQQLPSRQKEILSAKNAEICAASAEICAASAANTPTAINVLRRLT